MDLDQLKKILDLVREHELAEFEIEHEGLRLKIRKDAAGTLMTVPAMPTSCSSRLRARRCRPPPVAGPRRPRRPSGAGGQRDRARGRQVADRRHLLPIAEPGAASFVEVGSTVKKGQVLCIIEAMKLMNEIDSEYDGEVVNIYVENGQPVQYGERLFAIRRSRRRPDLWPRYVQEDPDREPRRSRDAHHLRVPRARHQDRRGLLGSRRELAAPPLRRRGRLHRPGAERRQLPERAGGDHAPPRSPAPTPFTRATGSSRRAPTSRRSARPATSGSSAPTRR